MAITKFISTVWSETLAKSLDKEYIAISNCNRSFEGDIRGKGSSVKICSVGPVSVFNYNKDTNMAGAFPEAISDSEVTLSISQAKAFNFQIDDIDRAQTNPQLMQEAMRQAANALADKADAYVYGLAAEAKTLGSPVITVDEMSSDDVLKILLNARRKLLENNVNSNVETVIEVPPVLAVEILKAKILTATDNTENIGKGYIGSFVGFDVYVSNNVLCLSGRYQCMARTKRAIAFAEQLSEVEAYRPEKRFADAVKGLHLYGAKVVFPGEIVVIDASPVPDPEPEIDDGDGDGDGDGENDED